MADSIYQGSGASGTTGSWFTCICSKKIVEEALDASWRSQLVPEHIMEVTGSPIAEFERVLYAVSPVVGTSHTCPEVTACNKASPCSSLLSKNLWPDISMLNVLDWYRECSAYGVEVKVGGSKNSNSFDVYFSPTLSEIQLIKQPLNSSSGDGASLPSCLPDDAEVIFDYFERDQADERLTFIDKVGILLSDSELNELKLRDLHPASWCSVHWKPIYGIPSKKASRDPDFGASFLTYHSLSHLALRHGRQGHTYVIPALGMIYYSGRDECWLQLKKPGVQTARNGLLYDVKEILEQRLRTLSLVASAFSNGHFWKKDIATINDHMDYLYMIVPPHPSPMLGDYP